MIGPKYIGANSLGFTTESIFKKYEYKFANAVALVQLGEHGDHVAPQIFLIRSRNKRCFQLLQLQNVELQNKGDLTNFRYRLTKLEVKIYLPAKKRLTNFIFLVYPKFSFHYVGRDKNASLC